MTQPTIRFAVIGINHGHIVGQCLHLLYAGAEMVSYWPPTPDPDDEATANVLADFRRAFPDVQPARSEAEILEDPTIHMIVGAAIPADRAPLGIRVMQHGKDYMTDKPGFTTLDQLAEARRVQAETGRIYSVCYSERFDVSSAVKAGELIQAGAIGKVVQTVGLGPHRIHPPARPGWFFKRERYGGILCDIGSHQADQFLFYTGSTSAEVVASQVANYKHPQHPELEDFGEVLFRGDGGNGYVRVDWYTPAGLPTWGDGKLVILGTDGYMELRKYIDIAGHPGGEHLFLVDHKGVHYIDCKGGERPYGPRLVSDVLNRTETAMSQAHCFLASELALKAEALATRLGYLR
ncbi:MAG: putative oxidoreductase YvaA [Chloroflexi bacterium ADurb.Bin325]|nr:MAG: putative oxidoreductase YvaA [Chloroflexi bacterium ADurb.Bin325]